MSLTSHSRVGKIHVAPCSCELHVRIRELEAELAMRTKMQDEAEADFQEAQARAEKAEARVAELEARLAYELVQVEGFTEADARRIIVRDSKGED